MDKHLIERIRTGLATAADLTSVPIEDVLAVKRDTSAPQSRFFAEKAFGVVREERKVIGVPHSTEGVDRMGDIIRVKGWQLDAYRKNPVLLFGHDKHSLPIAKALKVRKGQSATGMKSLLIDEVYHTEDLNPEAELVWRMVEAGALPGRSVGFIPIDAHMPETDEEREKLGLGKWGIEFREQELLESSIVPVPANAEALQGKCYAIAQATAKRAIEDGVATWGDVQRLAGILPITDLDAARINREQRRSHVAFPDGTGNVIELAGNEEFTTGTSTGVGVWQLGEVHNQDDIRAISDLADSLDDLNDDMHELVRENEQLREQIADLTRGIAALAKATEDRSDDVGVIPEHSSNDDAEESLYDTLFEKVEERRLRSKAKQDLASRLATRLGTGGSPKD